MDKIRVLIVDDSALMREALNSILSADPQIEVVGMAKDGDEGVKKALALKPNVITMDLKMPVMGGLEAIEQIMGESPIPIIVVSGMDVQVIVRALTIGAMDFVPVTQEIEQIAQSLIEKIKIASRVKPIRRLKVKPLAKISLQKKKAEANKVVAIGISTGGPQALQLVLSGLPQDLAAGILVVQHMSAGFMDGLIEWLRLSSAMEVKQASSGEALKAGQIIFAPDNYNMLIDEEGRISLKEDTARRLLHVPSVDEMMKSAAESFGRDTIGVIMTGMGRDGVEGIKAIKKSGGVTIAQDEKTSVVFGMNKQAIDAGCIDRVVPLEKIAEEIIRTVNNG